MNSFLKCFIAKEKYLQNPPMTTDKFIEFCKKRGIQTTKEELEFFEKEKLLFPIIRIDRPIGEEDRIKFYSRYDIFKEDVIGSYHNDLLLNWLEENNLFDPATRDFQSWNTFIGEELNYERQKIVSFYSSFQIYWLEKLKQINSIHFTHNKTDFSFGNCEIKTENGKVFLDADLKLKIEISNREEIQLSGGKIYKIQEHEKVLINRFKNRFDLKIKKEKLIKNYGEFNTILKFLLSVQAIYYPYFRSGGGTIQITGDYKKWQETRRNFKLDNVLEKLDLKIKDIAKWYKNFSDEAQKILGIKRDDWIQLWKNIAWSEKNNLEGNIRIGIEYLQWAVMLKRIIEEHLQKEILDIDEMSNISGDDILKIDTNVAKDKPMVTLRHLRNIKYSDQDKNYYHDRYKRLFYLANDFGLDYQPRVTVFVEGEIEETIFPEIFEQYIGNKPENLGIEFINIQGISQFFGRKISIKNSSGKYQKGFINNFNHLASYNLNKWQIIPFFIGDDENNISHLLKNGISISFNQNQYSFPKDWQYIWGITNDNKPFQGKDFEMANFGDSEIATVLSEVLNKSILEEQVKNKRDKNEGIKQIDSDVSKNKMQIAKKLFDNLFNKYKDERGESIPERPIFKVINKIRKLSALNYMPIDRETELKNKGIIENELKRNLLSSSSKL